jgi:hypothetical protein
MGGGYASGGKKGKFSNLTDTFDYAGLGGEVVKVKVDESGLETEAEPLHITQEIIEGLI